MIVKQYSVTLPADYDMGIIRQRVATKGPSFDDFPGLGVKVFMVREKGRHGAEGNQYAPLYLWPSVEPMWDSLPAPASEASWIRILPTCAPARSTTPGKPSPGPLNASRVSWASTPNAGHWCGLTIGVASRKHCPQAAAATRR